MDHSRNKNLIKKIVIISLSLVGLLIIIFIFFQIPLSKLNINNENGNYIVYNNTYIETINIPPGRRTITIAGPKIYKEISVFNWPFQTKYLFVGSEDDNISEEEVVNFALNKENVPDNKLDMCKTFDYEWIVCRGGLGSAESIAVHYSANNWKIVSGKGQILNAEAQQYYGYIIDKSKAEGQSVIER